MRKLLAIALFILAFTGGCRHVPSKTQPSTIYKTDSVFMKEYVVKKINDHEVKLISIIDTVTLYLENAYGFDERIVFIKK